MTSQATKQPNSSIALPSCKQFSIKHGLVRRGHKATRNRLSTKIFTASELAEELKKAQLTYVPCQDSPLSPAETEAIAETLVVTNPDSAASASLSDAFTSAADIDLSQPIEPPQYILRQLLPRGRLVLFVGNSTAGKTPLNYQMARDIVGGRDFLDYFRFESKEPVNVATIDAESLAEDIKLRLRNQHLGRSIEPLGSFFYTHRESTARLGLDVTEQNIARIRAYVVENNIHVLFLDNMWALSGGAKVGDGPVASEIISHLNTIITLPHKPTVVILHHPRKGPSDGTKRYSILDSDFIRWMEEASGSMVWVNRTDVRIGLERVTVNGNEYTVLRGRHRVPGGEQDIGPLFLSIDEKHDLARIDNSPEVLTQLGDKTQQVALRLRAKGKFDLSYVYSHEVLSAGGTNISKKTAQRALKRLQEHGLVSEPDERGMMEWRDGGERQEASAAPVVSPDIALAGDVLATTALPNPRPKRGKR